MDEGRVVWSWVSLASVVAMGAASAAFALTGGVASISARYDGPFSPAVYAWSIVPVGLSALLVFTVMTARARVPDEQRDAMAPPLVMAMVLGVAALGSLKVNLLLPAVGAMVAMLACALSLYARVARVVEDGASAWLRVPFSILLGWTTLVTVTGIAAALSEKQLLSGSFGGTWAAVITLALTGLFATLALRTRDPVLPMVFGWGTLAVYLEHLGGGALIAASTLTASIASLLVGTVIAVARRDLSAEEP